jgi:hypothetical protein
LSKDYPVEGPNFGSPHRPGGHPPHAQTARPEVKLLKHPLRASQAPELRKYLEQLNSAQGDILNRLRTLPASPAAGDTWGKRLAWQAGIGLGLLLLGFLAGTLIESRKENDRLTSVIRSLPYLLQAPALLQSHGGGVGVTSDGGPGRRVVWRPAGTVDFKRSQARSLFRSVKPFRYHTVLMLPDTLGRQNRLPPRPITRPVPVCMTTFLSRPCNLPCFKKVDCTTSPRLFKTVAQRLVFKYPQTHGSTLDRRDRKETQRPRRAERTRNGRPR